MKSKHQLLHDKYEIIFKDILKEFHISSNVTVPKIKDIVRAWDTRGYSQHIEFRYGLSNYIEAELKSFPHNCGIVILSGLNGAMSFRVIEKRLSDKIYKMFFNYISELIELSDYGAVIYTGTSDFIERFLLDDKWEKIYQFVNPKTENNIFIVMKTFNQPEY